MRWLSLLKYLLEGAMNWFAEWKHVFDAEKAEKNAIPPIDTPYTVVNDQKPPMR